MFSFGGSPHPPTPHQQCLVQIVPPYLSTLAVASNVAVDSSFLPHSDATSKDRSSVGLRGCIQEGEFCRGTISVLLRCTQKLTQDRLEMASDDLRGTVLVRRQLHTRLVLSHQVVLFEHRFRLLVSDFKGILKWLWH